MNRNLAEECARLAWEAKREWWEAHGSSGHYHSWEEMPAERKEMEIAGMTSALTHVGLHALGGFFAE
jgi:hypothetical protein